MKNLKFLTLLLLSLFFVNAFSQAPINVNDAYRLKLDQPVTTEWAKARFKNETPLLMLSTSRLTQIKTAIKNDSTVNKLYRIYKRDADYLCASKPQGKGNSTLAGNREAIYRNTTLALVALVETDNKKYINRLNDELLDLSAKTQLTNPLDCTERAFAMAVGMSWGKNWLPKTTVALVKTTLVDDFLLPSLELAKQNKGSVERSNNWELVYNSGLMAAAIVTADVNPKLSAEVISRSLDKLPQALDADYPQIAHLEDNMSRNYGAIYTIYALEMCRETFGTDFGFSKSPGFMEAPLLDLISISPTGQTFDFYEDKANGSNERFSVFSWFDTQLQRPHYFDRVAYNERLKARFNGNVWNIVDRYEPLSILWLVENKYSKNKMILPEKYFGKGLNPLVVMRSKTDAHGFYFAAKGGKSSTSQGKMDAGSFVYELDGVRWAINLDLQHTEAAEKVMGSELWNFKQTAKRWELLSFNNFGHNTLTVNGQFFDVDAALSIL